MTIICFTTKGSTRKVILLKASLGSWKHALKNIFLNYMTDMHLNKCGFMNLVYLRELRATPLSRLNS